MNGNAGGIILKSRAWRFLRLEVDEAQTALRCLLMLALVIGFGTVGFMLVEEWSAWKSLFFTLITVTTVGYGDMDLSDSGQKFAALLLLCGIGTATYSISSLVQIAISYNAAWKQRMQGKIDHFEDHFIICGFGRIGRTIAEQLHASRVQFVVVDCCKEMVDLAIESGYAALCGNSTEDETLILSGIERARGVICATNSDAENVFVTLSAKELNPDVFIASRASTPQTADRIRRAGAKVVVSPYTTAGEFISDAILRPRLSSFLRHQQNSGFEMGGVTIDEKSQLVGRKLCEVGEQFPDVVFVSIQRGGKAPRVRPPGNETFEGGDEVMLVAAGNELERICVAASAPEAAGCPA